MQIMSLQTGLLSVNTYIVPCASEFVQNNEVFVVDPGGDTEVIVNQIASTNSKLVGIVLTHGHFDHVGALAALKEAFPNALVCIHQGDIDYVGENGYATHQDRFSKIGFDGADFFTHTTMPNADCVLEDGNELPFAPGWVVVHTPGHTEGSVCIYNKTHNVLLSGDTLFKMAYGRTDLPGGSFSKLKDSLKKLFALPDNTIVYPGHESSTTIGAEKNMPL